MSYKYITETFLMDNKHWILSSLSIQNGANLYQNLFGGRASPGPLRELHREPTSKGGRGLLIRGGMAWGLLLRVTEGRREGRKRRGREFPPPKSR